MSKNTPAFPTPHPCGVVAGMTLRDYFAAKAMQGALAGEPGGHLIPDRLATISYRYADAMLAAREGDTE